MDNLGRDMERLMWALVIAGALAGALAGAGVLAAVAWVVRRLSRVRRARFLFEPRDLWVGCYWRKDGWGVMRSLTLYFCIVPCLPLRVDLEWRA